MSDRTVRRWQKEQMLAQCANLGIQIPENANIRQLRALRDEYFKEAVIVRSGNGVCLRQTDKPTSEYSVEYTIRCIHTIRAESEEAACEWLKYEVSDMVEPRFGEMDDVYLDVIIDVITANDEE